MDESEIMQKLADQSRLISELMEVDQNIEKMLRMKLRRNNPFKDINAMIASEHKYRAHFVERIQKMQELG